MHWNGGAKKQVYAVSELTILCYTYWKMRAISQETRTGPSSLAKLVRSKAKCKVYYFLQVSTSKHVQNRKISNATLCERLKKLLKKRELWMEKEHMKCIESRRHIFRHGIAGLNARQNLSAESCKNPYVVLIFSSSRSEIVFCTNFWLSQGQKCHIFCREQSYERCHIHL